MTTDVNAILKTYLGAGPNGGYQPIGLEQRFKTAFPEDHEAKLSQIAKYLAEDHQPDWSKRGLAEETDLFATRLADRFPELDRVVAYALACRWSYSNK